MQDWCIFETGKGLFLLRKDTPYCVDAVDLGCIFWVGWLQYAHIFASNICGCLKEINSFFLHLIVFITLQELAFRAML